MPEEPKPNQRLEIAHGYPENITMRYNFVCALANYLKDKEAALQMVGPLFEKMGTGLVDHAKVDPDLACIRDDPRFKAMLTAAEARLASELSKS
jgi:adenylate cyclase